MLLVIDGLDLVLGERLTLLWDDLDHVANAYLATRRHIYSVAIGRSEASKVILNVNTGLPAKNGTLFLTKGKTL